MIRLVFLTVVALGIDPKNKRTIGLALAVDTEIFPSKKISRIALALIDYGA